MSVETVARRYAAALADVVVKTGETSTVRTELKAWEAMLLANQDLAAVFANPAISHLNKEAILSKLLEKSQPGRTTANFLKVLLQNGRLGEIAEINNRFESEIEARSGNVVARITSARELSDGEKSELSASLVGLTGKQVKPEYLVDKNILGGVVTQIGSTVYDGSVRTKLDNLKAELIGV